MENEILNPVPKHADDLLRAFGSFVFDLEKLNPQLSGAQSEPFLHKKPAILIFRWKAVAQHEYGLCIANGFDYGPPLNADRIEDARNTATVLYLSDEFAFDRHCPEKEWFASALDIGGRSRRQQRRAVR